MKAKLDDEINGSWPLITGEELWTEFIGQDPRIDSVDSFTFTGLDPTNITTGGTNATLLDYFIGNPGEEIVTSDIEADLGLTYTQRTSVVKRLFDNSAFYELQVHRVKTEKYSFRKIYMLNLVDPAHPPLSKLVQHYGGFRVQFDMIDADTLPKPMSTSSAVGSALLYLFGRSGVICAPSTVKEQTGFGSAKTMQRLKVILDEASDFTFIGATRQNTVDILSMGLRYNEN